MVAFKFPMGSGKYIGEISVADMYDLCKDYCCMFRVAFTNLVHLKSIEHPLSASKCRWKDGKKLLSYRPKNDYKSDSPEVLVDNGRVITAKYLETTCTEQDFRVYEKFYTWEGCKIFDCWIYPKSYLPTPFIKAILTLYKQKTTLKGVEGEEVNYLLSKEMINSAYGMTVTDIVRENLEYSLDAESGCHSNYDDPSFDNETYVAQQIERYNNNPYRFLFYAWGVWVTSYARANLFSGIVEADKDYIYSDTDSIKMTNYEKHLPYIDRYNNWILEKLKAACEYHGIDFEEIQPKNIKGESKPLGVWEFEGVYDRFKTLGAKRYMYQKGDKWSLTAAGVNKSSGMEYILKRAQAIGCDPFDLFSLNLVVPPEYSGRNTLTYIDNSVEGVIEDYTGQRAHFEELSGIHMESSEYSFNPVDEFIHYLFTIREERW